MILPYYPRPKVEEDRMIDWPVYGPSNERGKPSNKVMKARQKKSKQAKQARKRNRS